MYDILYIDSYLRKELLKKPQLWFCPWLTKAGPEAGGRHLLAAHWAFFRHKQF